MLLLGFYFHKIKLPYRYTVELFLAKLSLVPHIGFRYFSDFEKNCIFLKMQFLGHLVGVKGGLGDLPRLVSRFRLLWMQET